MNCAPSCSATGSAGTQALLAGDAGDDPAQLLAVRRAALTAVAEAAERADDSEGEIGQLGRQTWQGDVTTLWGDLLDPATSWRDVGEPVAFDDEAHLHENEAVPSGVLAQARSV